MHACPTVLRKIKKAKFSQAHRKLITDTEANFWGKAQCRDTWMRTIIFLEKIYGYEFIKSVIPDENVTGGSLLQQDPGKVCVDGC